MKKYSIFIVAVFFIMAAALGWFLPVVAFNVYDNFYDGKGGALEIEQIDLKYRDDLLVNQKISIVNYDFYIDNYFRLDKGIYISRDYVSVFTAYLILSVCFMNQFPKGRMNYENEMKLQEGHVVGDVSVQTMRNALLEVEAAVAQTKAQEVNARNNLSYTEVKSPVSGVASMIPWHVGSLVSSNISEPLVTVADDSEVYVYFSISENQALDLISQYGSINEFISKAPAISLRLNNGKDYEQQGRISAVSGTVDTQTGAVTLRATFPNPGGLLHHGGSATVVVPTHRSQCIVIPQEATYELQNRMFVYRVVDGKTKATPVTLFPQNNGREYIVEEGISEGDTIIAEGAGLLKDGIEVKGEK